MSRTALEIVSFGDPVWTISSLLFFGITFLLLIEKWTLSVPKTLPWMGEMTGIFPRISACLREKHRSLPGLQSGYLKFGSKGEFFVKPDLGFEPEIMVPQEHVRWILDQPEDVLAIREARYEKFAIDFMLPAHDATIDRIFLETIHRNMTRNILRLHGALIEEVSSNMDKVLGTDMDNWVEANVWVTIENTVFSAVMRILVGQSICRNDVFKADVSGYSKAFGFSSIFVGRILPKFLRPTMGWLLSGLTLIRQKNLIKKWFMPLIEERFANLLRKSQDPAYDYNPPEDLITWTSDALLNSGNAERCKPNELSKRLAIMIPASIPAVKATSTNVVYDILSSPPDIKLQEHLYDEIADALDASSGKGWADPNLIPRLVFLNSTIRETLRCNPGSLVVMQRKVLPSEGITLPSGHHLPRGSWIGVPTVGIHSDEKFYSNASEYDPFRFCSTKPRKEPGGKDSALRVTTNNVVNVTDTFLPFGGGKFACPGRWLASHVIKLTIAYLLYNYELKPFSQRPLNTQIFGSNMPNRQITMMVRRRKH